jgi:hypothetical protein
MGELTMYSRGTGVPRTVLHLAAIVLVAGATGCALPPPAITAQARAGHVILGAGTAELLAFSPGDTVPERLQSTIPSAVRDSAVGFASTERLDPTCIRYFAPSDHSRYLALLYPNCALRQASSVRTGSIATLRRGDPVLVGFTPTGAHYWHPITPVPEQSFRVDPPR